jgi:hypothetical protein
MIWVALLLVAGLAAVAVWAWYITGREFRQQRPPGDGGSCGLRPWRGQVAGLCWPHFGRAAALKPGYQGALMNNIPAGQRGGVQIPV